MEVRLIAGENVYGDDNFDALIASRTIAVVQPDLAQWGGVSGVLGLVSLRALKSAVSTVR